MSTEAVNEYMQKLEHPLKAEIEAVRSIILKADKKLAERVKWSAPSFYYKHDLATFNHRATKHVHLVFHHIAITRIPSALLEGDYKDRRMVYLKDMKDVKAKKKELDSIFKQLVRMMDEES
ncbi:MAG: DUF1801 domain-containing protein [Bacteroidota bacterium]